MGRVAAFTLSLVAIGLVTALGVWLLFAVITRARSAYWRYQRGRSHGGKDD